MRSGDGTSEDVMRLSEPPSGPGPGVQRQGPRNGSPRPWRVGSRVGRTVYDREDRLIGVMDTVSDAQYVVEAVNAHRPGERDG